MGCTCGDFSKPLQLARCLCAGPNCCQRRVQGPALRQPRSAEPSALTPRFFFHFFFSDVRALFKKVTTRLLATFLPEVSQLALPRYKVLSGGSSVVTAAVAGTAILSFFVPMLSFFVVLTSGAFIQSPLHTPQLAKQHHARVLLPRAAPSAMAFDPGDQILVSPAAVVLGVVVCVPIRLAITGTIDALMAVLTGTPLGLIRVEVRALLPALPPVHRMLS